MSDYEAGFAEGLRAALLIVESRLDVMQASRLYVKEDRRKGILDAQLQVVRTIKDRMGARYQESLKALREAVEEK